MGERIRPSAGIHGAVEIPHYSAAILSDMNVLQGVFGRNCLTLHVMRHTSKDHLGIVLNLALIHSSALFLCALQSAPAPLNVELKIAFVCVAIRPNTCAFAVSKDSLTMFEV